MSEHRDAHKKRPSEVSGRLVVVETEEAFLVAQEGDPSDWLIAYSKAWGGQAREWAQRVVRLHNDTMDRQGS